MTQQIIVAYTLVDITETNTVHVRDSNTKQYHQMQNLHVLLQTIGLRAQPLNFSVTKFERISLDNYKFADFNVTAANVWALQFEVEHELIWANENGPLDELINDANSVAITSDLDNTVEFLINQFDTKSQVNLYFEIGLHAQN